VFLKCGAFETLVVLKRVLNAVIPNEVRDPYLTKCFAGVKSPSCRSGLYCRR
jgi:hypothetical protein